MEALQIWLITVTTEVNRLSSTPMPPDVMIGIRLFIVIGSAYVLVNMIRSWQAVRRAGQFKPKWICNIRTVQAASVFLVATGLALSALITSGTGGNTPAYQLLVQVGILSRLLTDAYSAGQRIRSASKTAPEGGET